MDTIKRLSHWFRGSKKPQETSSSSQISSSFRSGFYDLDSSNPQSPSSRIRASLSPRRVKRPGQCTIDKEYNIVMVPSDGECFSESDSDGSDWSIGWLEPHGSDFEPEPHKKESSFAVLVPCYKTGTIQRKAESFNRLSGVGNNNASAVSGSESYTQQWLSSLPDLHYRDNRFYIELPYREHKAQKHKAQPSFMHV
ncbi:Stromelysin-2 [Rhynchospora pubera]|uniref:Stromelysin-2 n=1 Tax=Rhynchospora pubera TaxID=906938 RepID=A0AAV8G5E5_9POAL|nr:Stromelysin-2 [Rhynchospora pubera]